MWVCKVHKETSELKALEGRPEKRECKVSKDNKEAKETSDHRDSREKKVHICW